ncbi:MAG: BACON domain-containing protein [Bacteroidales bacterium]|nr:BACON domain-containing protein [Candidatus Cryptobacteroides equifaecalis]
MRTINYIKFAALSLCMALGLASCKKADIKEPAHAVAAEYASMEFAAVGAEPQVLPVYADGIWTIENDSEWIDINPMTGYGNMDVTVTVADNLDGKVVDLPRKAKIYLKSGSSDPGQNGSVTINQKGDKYKGLTPVTVAEANALAKEAVAKFSSVQVMATSLAGMVVGDATGVIFISGMPEGVVSGDNVSLTGEVLAGAEGDPNIIALDYETVEVLSHGKADYSSAKNITAGIDSYEGSYLELVSVKGSIIGLANEDILAGAAIRVKGAEKRMMVVEADAPVKMADVNYHFVTVAGYYFGKLGANPSFIPAKILEDGGIDESIVPVPLDPNTVLFSDDFEWMDPFVAAAKAAGTDIGDSVGENNASASAPNLYTTASLADLGAEMIKRGYVDIAPEGKVMYPQANYWKFCKTSVNTGLQLPSIDYYGELDLNFDWSPQMTGSGNIDKVILVVMVTTGNTVVTAGQFSYEDWQKGQIAWHPAKTKIQITPESLIHIRPISLEDYAGITQQRFYLDNIVVKVPGPDVDPVYANIEVDEDVLAFEGEGGEKVITITSDHEFVVNTPDKWITIENGKGLKNEPTEVTVKCEASELSKLREGKITIISADSEMVLRVIQSAAGQDLDPFVSLSQNRIDISGKARDITVGVQSTEEYTITCSEPWVSIAPETKTTVNKESVTLSVAANPDKVNAREARVVFAIESKGVESVLTICQAAAEPDDPSLIFSDDFSWLTDMIQEYNKANPTKPVGNSVTGYTKEEYAKASSANAPNAYTTEPFKTAFPAALAAAGYTDLNPGGQVLYPQDTYLKFGKTSVHTSLQFAPFKSVEGKVDATLSFDWCRHVQGTAKIDPVELVVVLVGEGQFENGTKVSDALTTAQTYVENTYAEMGWTNSAVKISGADKDTKLNIVYKDCLNADGTYNWKVSGAHRYHIDNIKVRKAASAVVFSDDFEWMDEASTAAGAGDSVKDNNPSASAPNIYSTAALAPLQTALADKGYDFVNSAKNGTAWVPISTKNEKVVYLQKNYLKFGKTSYNAGIVLPALTALTETTDVKIEFDWCWQVTGAFNPDIMTLQVEAAGAGTFEATKTSVSAELKSAQSEELGKSNIEWQHVTVTLKGADATTRLTIRPTNSNSKVSNPDRDQNRWYLDNIKITR